MTADNNNNGYRVETTSRLAQWRIGNLSNYTYRKSDPFKIGKWNWHIGVEKSRCLVVKVFPEVSSFTRENPPLASFVIRLFCSSRDRKPLLHPEVRDKQIKSSDDFIWEIDLPLTTGRFIIEVEFFDLKTSSLQGGDPRSIWDDALFPRRSSDAGALSSLTKMLTDSILTDIVIHASDGVTLRAHRAILASRSPVFRSMFSHNLTETRLSVLSIPDISSSACQAFLSYLYGGLDTQDFLEHRLALVGAADKYDVEELKEACHASLMEDIDVGNVLERLRSAWMYGLEGLKSACLRYLVGFGKVCDVKEEFGEFVKGADKELVTEVFMEILSAWKGF